MLQYADDDAPGVLEYDCSLKSSLDVINSFGKIISGVKINISKSECMDIGVSCGRKEDFLDSNGLNV